ncbi:MAG TPA: hypothetical protein VNR87_12865 [Flavisolibacter sp.]|nr:hypothetical protein [Flavisolibacter sp.]
MKLLLYTALVAALSSCYAYKIYPKEDRDFEYYGEKRTAFIVNPELKKEYAVLERSGIFHLSNDSSSSNVVKIRLHKLNRNFLCGQPIVASLMTFGQLPVYFPDLYFFSFEEFDGTVTQERKFELKIAQRYWFWDLFTFEKNFKKKAGKALLANYYRTSSSTPAAGSHE